MQVQFFLLFPKKKKKKVFTQLVQVKKNYLYCHLVEVKAPLKKKSRPGTMCYVNNSSGLLIKHLSEY